MSEKRRGEQELQANPPVVVSSTSCSQAVVRFLTTWGERGE